MDKITGGGESELEHTQAHRERKRDPIVNTLGRRPVHRPALQGGQARVDEAFAEARVQGERCGQGHGAGADVLEGLVVFVFV